MTFVPSAYQQAGFDFVAKGRGSAILMARAGSGKSTWIEEAVPFIPKSHWVSILAFGADIAKEWKETRLPRLFAKNPDIDPKRVQAKTFHSVCFGAVAKHLGVRANQLKVDGGKARRLFRANVSEEAFEVYGSFVVKLLGFAMGEGIGVLRPDAVQEWQDLIDHHDLCLDSEDGDEGVAVRYAQDLLRWSIDAVRGNSWLSFDEMLYLVLKWRLRLFQVDDLFVDECFVPETPVLVGLNGEQRPIRDLYDSCYTGPIVTWSEEQGTHLSRVIKVKRIPVGKPMVRIRTRQRGFTKNGDRLSVCTEQMRYGVRTLVCTADHKIWTDQGWLSAGDLAVGMTVKHETVAPIVRSYQSRYAHTAKGRVALAEKADRSRFGDYRPVTFTGIRGGNGRGPSRGEKLLLERLGDGWVFQHVIRTRVKRQNFVRGSGHRDGDRGLFPGSTFEMDLPTHYKIDLANVNMMIAVEVDGRTHEGREEADARKESWLREHGWTVVRITNEEVRSFTDELLQERIYGCAVDAEVVEVESWENRKHEYVYDLEVEGTHCYFAHGLLVHNCQDTNPVRRAIARLMLRPGGRSYWVGDDRQAIFGFTGASHNALDLIRESFNCTVLPLSVCYRCGSAIVRHAAEVVPDIEPAPGAVEGSVEDLDLDELLDGELKSATAFTDVFGPHDAILCRNTAPLIGLAYRLIAKRIGCRILGKDIAEGLVQLIRAQKAQGVDRLVKKLEAWRDREVAKAVAKEEEAKAEAVTDRVACVLTVIENLPEDQRTIPKLVQSIESMFSDENGVLTLSTIHKAKGKEWATVGIYRPELMPSKWARMPHQEREEQNLIYVARTRAKERLVYLNGGEE